MDEVCAQNIPVDSECTRPFLFILHHQPSFVSSSRDDCMLYLWMRVRYDLL